MKGKPFLLNRISSSRILLTGKSKKSNKPIRGFDSRRRFDELFMHDVMNRFDGDEIDLERGARSGAIAATSLGVEESTMFYSMTCEEPIRSQQPSQNLKHLNESMDSLGADADKGFDDDDRALVRFAKKCVLRIELLP